MAEEDEWTVVSSLVEPQRRDLYGYVRAQHRPVTRDEAAAACGISRSLAAFHLDKLVQVGLLSSSTRAGEGAARGRGRPPKAYRVGDAEIRLVVPERHLDLLGEILLDVVATPDGAPHQDALVAARQRGERQGRAYRPRRPRGRRGFAALTEALDALGSEPRAEDADRIVLANCPFRPLAERRPELVCRICHSFCEGLIEGVGAQSAQALADPAPGRCCIAIRRR